MALGETNGRAIPAEIKSWIEEGIQEGVYKPGDRLDENELRRRFGVSRTPVREALLQLASIDVVVFRPRKGALVAQLSIKEIAAMWEVLATLEGLCAALAARRMNDQELEALRNIHERSIGLSDVRSYAEVNHAFHECIYVGCRNDYLSARVQDIRNRLRGYRRYPFERLGGIERSRAGHAAVLEAVLSGNDQQADLAMRDHVASGLSFLDLVAELPVGALPPEEPGQAPAAEKVSSRRRPAKPRRARRVVGAS